jgi:hypothetical protein
MSCATQMNGDGVSPDGPYNITTTVGNRPALVTDTDKGVVLAAALVDNPANRSTTLTATEIVPCTYTTPQLTKLTRDPFLAWKAWSMDVVWIYLCMHRGEESEAERVIKQSANGPPNGLDV